jgi:hypothetical protein
MRSFALLLTVFLVACTATQVLAQDLPSLAPARDRDTLIKFAANPQAGFYFDYLVYLPKGTQIGVSNYLMVETNNGGVNDTMAYHEKWARHAASRSGVGNYVARKLVIPFLVPIFPRSQTNWKVYTHALDRDAFLSRGDSIERLDLQLLAMVEDARKQLVQQGYPVKEKFFMTGFSASGTFANRLSLLHPEKIQAVATGGINAIAILPVAEVQGKTLDYPLGIADVEKVTGRAVNLAAFRVLPKLLYMGALDDNDAAAFADGYSKEESALVYELMGKQLIPQRWSFMEEQYKKNKVEAEFRTYPDIGHGTDLKILNDLVEFFKKYAHIPNP